MRKKDRIDYVLNGVCAYYGITLDELTSTRARSVKKYRQKRITIKILRDIADCSFKDIRYCFKHGDESNTWQIHQHISEDLDSDSSFNRELKKEYADILKFLGL